MAEELKQPEKQEKEVVCKHCGMPIEPTSYGWIHKKRLVSQCNIFAEPEIEKTMGDIAGAILDPTKQVFLKLNLVQRKDLKDGKKYIFKNGGVWRLGEFDKKSNMIYSGQMEIPGSDSGILFEIPEG